MSHCDKLFNPLFILFNNNNINPLQFKDKTEESSSMIFIDPYQFSYSEQLHYSLFRNHGTVTVFKSTGPKSLHSEIVTEVVCPQEYTDLCCNINKTVLDTTICYSFCVCVQRWKSSTTPTIEASSPNTRRWPPSTPV